MAKIWDAICNAVGRRETAAEREAVLGAAPYTFRPPEPPPMPEFPTERPMTARQRDFEEQTRRDFAAGKRETYIDNNGALRSYSTAERLNRAREDMATAFRRIDNARADLAATGYTGGPPRGPAQLSAVRETIAAQEAAAGREWPPRREFGKRKEPPPPLPLPKDTANICTMVIREDLAFLRRIEEIRLTGGKPAVIDIDRQVELEKVIAYAMDAADANGELTGMAFLRAWINGIDAAKAELRAYIADENSY